MIVRNPKDGKTLETSLDEKKAIEICEKIGNPFAQKLAHQAKYGNALSPVQYYWLFKIAEENKPAEPIALASNLQEFISKVPLLQFKVELEDRTLGKIFLRTTPHYIDVALGFRSVGMIKDDRFLPSNNCPAIVKVELALMSIDPMGWMQRYGKATGTCCVCGRELTNEESVSMGIGPICAQRWA